MASISTVPMPQQGSTTLQFRLLPTAMLTMALQTLTFNALE